MADRAAPLPCDSLNKRQMVEFTEIELYLPQLPDAMDGLRILHLSDLHTRGYGRRERKLHSWMRQNSKAYDMLIISGDFCYQWRIGNIFSENCDQTELLRIGLSRDGLVFPPRTGVAVDVCRKLLADCKPALGIYADQGNHDPDDFMVELAKLGVCVLTNETRQISLADNAGSFNLCGVQCHGRKTCDIPETLFGMDSSLFTVAVNHFPELSEPLVYAGVDLILTGHTHGGQVCLPGRRPILTHNRTGQKFAAGLERIENSYVFTSRGLGCSLLPIRTFCPPEFARITLHKGDQSKTRKKAQRTR